MFANISASLVGILALALFTTMSSATDTSRDNHGDNHPLVKFLTTFISCSDAKAKESFGQTVERLLHDFTRPDCFHAISRAGLQQRNDPIAWFVGDMFDETFANTAYSEIKTSLSAMTDSGTGFSCLNQAAVRQRLEKCLNSSIDSIHTAYSGTRDEAVDLPLLCGLVSPRPDVCVWRELQQDCSDPVVSILHSVLQVATGSRCLEKNKPLAYSVNATDAYQCYSDFEQRFNQGMRDASGQGDLEEFGKAMSYVDEFCASERQKIVPCIVKNVMASSKPVDMVVKTLVDVEKLVGTVEFACNNVDLVKTHLICMFGLAPKIQNSTCAKEALTEAQSLNYAVQSPASLSNMTAAVCSVLDTMVSCGKPFLSSCDAKLGNAVEELIWRLSTCRDVSSSAESVFVSLLTVAVCLLVTLIRV